MLVHDNVYNTFSAKIKALRLCENAVSGLSCGAHG
jgi:hypothetical protein